MKTIKMEIKAGADIEEEVRKVREGILKQAKEMGLPGPALARLEAEMDKTVATLLAEGPAKASMKTTIRVVKDAEELLEEVPEALLSIAKNASKSAMDTGQAAAHSFVLGGITADIVTARDLLAAARGRLRDHMDCECHGAGHEKREEKKPEPSAEPAEAAARA